MPQQNARESVKIIIYFAAVYGKICYDKEEEVFLPCLAQRGEEMMDKRKEGSAVSGFQAGKN